MFKLLSLLSALCSVFVFIACGAAHAQVVGGDLAGSYKGSCAPQVMNICGVSLMATPSPIGSVLTLNLPDRFVNRSVLVQCINKKEHNYYSIMGANQSICALKTCKPAAATVCNVPIPVEQEMQIDEVRKITVPATFLAASRKGVLSSFMVKCNLKDGQGTIETINSAGLSCNDFPCDPTVIKLCNQTVSMKDYGELGQVIKTASDQQKPVTVQCLGSVGNRPVYQITDSTQLGCE